jgi:hypothetical protein
LNILSPRFETRATAIGVAALALVGGMIAGPGYYLYCTQLTGSQIGAFDLSRSAQAGRFGQREINLDSLMNPVGMVWSGQVQSSGSISGSVWNAYKASLFLGEQRITVREFSLSRSGNDTDAARTWISLGSAEVPAAGRYRFVLEEIGKPQLAVSAVRIEFRRNVIAPNGGIVFAGWLAAIGGFVMFFVILWWREIRAYLWRAGKAAEPAEESAADLERKHMAKQMAGFDQMVGFGSRGAMVWLCVFVVLMVALFIAKSQGYLP